MKPPSISVIIPAYNAAATLERSLASILAADYDGEREVIVVDDRSTDATAGIAERMGCRLIRQEANGGPALARNAGARTAHGDILLFVDADTEMRPDSIRKAVAALDEDGVGAVTGTYEPEPLNTGFFPAYYAYLKYYAFTVGDVRRIGALGAQCAAIRRELYEAVGGYRPIAWGVDIENEEIGRRIHQHSAIALSREFRVAHHFPGFRKLLFIFTRRVYWWVLFRHYSRRDETVLMTRAFGLATAALPAMLLSLAGVLVFSSPTGSMVSAIVASGLGAGFVHGYAGFWRFCRRRRGAWFALRAIPASMFFACVITASAARAWLTIIGSGSALRSGFLRRAMAEPA